MKRLLLIVLILCLAMPVSAQQIVVMKKKSGCSDTEKHSQTSNNAQYNSNNSEVNWAASDFIPSSSYCISKVQLKLTKVGSPSYNTSVAIMSESSYKPNAVIGTSSDVATSSIGTESTVNFTFAECVSVNSGTHYWVRLNFNGNHSTANYVRIHYQNDVTGTHGIGRYTTSWAGVDSTAGYYLVVYACE